MKSIDQSQHIAAHSGTGVQSRVHLVGWVVVGAKNVKCANYTTRMPLDEFGPILNYPGLF